jgi:hypothetical protein
MHSSIVKNLAPRHSIFALLCSLASLAVSSFQQTAALIPLNLFAVILIPIPVPQINIPKSALPVETASAPFLP